METRSFDDIITPITQKADSSNEIELVESYINSVGFHICHKRIESAREAKFSAYDDMGLSKRAYSFLKNRGINQLWTHQYNAICETKKGNNICITTSTSSGKTEVFQVSAIEVLAKNPKAKVLAVYPMKALNRQQVERWEKTGYTVGKIDGDNSDIKERMSILENNRIVVMTPVLYMPFY